MTRALLAAALLLAATSSFAQEAAPSPAPAAAPPHTWHAVAPGHETASSPETARAAQEGALRALEEGNARFAGERQAPRDQGAARRSQLAKGQHPRVAILSCSDSRVPPELVFDQQLGEVFVVRTAGNVADPVVLGSLEYAVQHLGLPLIVVLGHGSCGAVKAAVQVHLGEERVHGNVLQVVRRILPAVERAARSHPDDLVQASIRANATGEAKALVANSPVLAAKVRAGQLRIVTAIYDLETGTVAFAQ